MDPIFPDWPAPARVRACCTTRTGGTSTGPYASLNLGDHVGDDPARVAENRARVARVLDLPAEPAWLVQVHGSGVADAAEVKAGAGCRADAAVARGPGAVCAVLTADCLPLLFCDRGGTRVAAVHAGWRGLAGGVIESAVAALGADPANLLAWLGPAIGPQAFEVGPEVRDAFLAADPPSQGRADDGAEAAFRSSPNGRWLADLYALARRRLAALGVHAVYGGGQCTASDPGRFYSYRRDGTTGRMASLIWLLPP